MSKYDFMWDNIMGGGGNVFKKTCSRLKIFHSFGEHLKTFLGTWLALCMSLYVTVHIMMWVGVIPTSTPYWCDWPSSVLNLYNSWLDFCFCRECNSRGGWLHHHCNLRRRYWHWERGKNPIKICTFTIGLLFWRLEFCSLICHFGLAWMVVGNKTLCWSTSSRWCGNRMLFRHSSFFSLLFPIIRTCHVHWWVLLCLVTFFVLPLIQESSLQHIEHH